MKKIALFVFLIVIAFSANAQDKPSLNETIQSIESVLNDNSKKLEWSIKGDIISISRVDPYYNEYIKEIHWDLLEFEGANDPAFEAGHVSFTLYFKKPCKLYRKFSSDDKFDITKQNRLTFYIAEDKVEALKNAFLRLKEIYK